MYAAIKRIPIYLFFLLLLGSSAHAQAIQTKACSTDLSTGYAAPCTLNNPVVAGDMVIAVALNGCNAAMLNNPAVACSGIADNQQNVWQIGTLGAPYYNYVPLWYALNVKGGSETVTFAPNTARLAFVAEYPPSSGVDSANYGSYNGQNPPGDPQGQSSDFGTTMPFVTTQANDQLIAWGYSGGPLLVGNSGPWIATPGTGFTIRGQICGDQNPCGGLVLEDSIAITPGSYAPTIHWAGYGHWLLNAMAFKTKPAHTATLTWIDTLNPAGTTYNVYRATGQCPGASFSRIASGLPGLSYVDGTIVSGQIYCYEVSAVSGGTESLKSMAVFLPGGVTSLTVK